MKLLLILPAYNEKDNIVNTVDQIRRFQKSNPTVVEVDYLVINDGSTDTTEQVCRENDIKCLSLIQNLGIGGAVQTGYIYAFMNGYDIAVQFDGDGQHDVNSLPDLIAPILSGEADFTVGSRFVEKGKTFQSTFLRRVGIRHLSLLIRLVSGLKISDVTSGYRAANKKTIAFLAKNYPTDYPEPESVVTLKKNKFRIKEVQVNMFERAAGKSSISSWKSIYYMCKVSFAIICASIQKREVK
ncbi:MAG: glycosyltransferase family 2 protein [Clostridia bacterium]|nr:glycosyltransferase family 2 protein [Clostridia bacterium]